MNRRAGWWLAGLGLVAMAGPAGAVPLDPGHGFTSAPDLAALPDGGFLAVWVRDRQVGSIGGAFCTPERLVGARLDDDGSLAAAPRAIELPESDVAWNPRVAATDGGATALSWQSAAGLRVGALRGDLSIASASLLTSCSVRSHALVAAGDGFWAAWSESCAGLRVRAQRLDERARPVGPAVEVADPFGDPGAGIALAGRPDGGFSATWIESVGDIGRRVLGGRFRADGSLVNAVFPVSPGASTAGLSLAAATLADGQMAFAWKDGDGRLLWRRFTPTPAPSGPIVQAAELAAPREEDPRFAVGPAGTVVLAWHGSAASPPCRLRVFDQDGTPLTGEVPMAEGCRTLGELTFSAAGALLATWAEQADITNIFCQRAEASVLALDPLPPPVEPIAPPAFPDFRFWVRIGGDEPAPRIGAEELACLPETVCVSGALPGRTEVLLRILGPRPNGYLWPTVVRFTTSTVEVWIEKVSTGVGRYYRLEGASPGSEELTGFFDRTGFPP